MGAVDFKVNSAVRSVLSRHWIDFTRIGFGSVNGTVRLAGILARLSNESEESHLTAKNVMQIESELTAIKSVKRVYFDLDNWRKDESRQWVCTEALRAEGGD